MKHLMTIIFIFVQILLFGQTSANYDSPSENFKIDSSNYIKELSLYMDTTFFNRYEEEIIEFEKEDSVQGISKGKILFVGSSSFRKWTNMKKDLYPLPVLNRGFGGSTMPELDYYFFRIVKPYKPAGIIIYEGDNDVMAPFLTPEVILKSFVIFTELTKQYLQKTKIFFVSIKPSPSRAEYLSKMEASNKLIYEYCNKDNDLFYVDITKPMFTDSGKIRDDIFQKDMLHMNEKGYKIWAKIIKKALTDNL